MVLIFVKTLTNKTIMQNVEALINIYWNTSLRTMFNYKNGLNIRYKRHSRPSTSRPTSSPSPRHTSTSASTPSPTWRSMLWCSALSSRSPCSKPPSLRTCWKPSRWRCLYCLRYLYCLRHLLHLDVISLLLKSFVAFRCDICFNGKLQVPEKFYIGSEEDKDKSDEQVLIIILFIISLLS